MTISSVMPVPDCLPSKWRQGAMCWKKKSIRRRRRRWRSSEFIFFVYFSSSSYCETTTHNWKRIIDEPFQENDEEERVKIPERLGTREENVEIIRREWRDFWISYVTCYHTIVAFHFNVNREASHLDVHWLTAREKESLVFCYFLQKIVRNSVRRGDEETLFGVDNLITLSLGAIKCSSVSHLLNNCVCKIPFLLERKRNKLRGNWSLSWKWSCRSAAAHLHPLCCVRQWKNKENQQKESQRVKMLKRQEEEAELNILTFLLLTVCVCV